MGLESLVFVLCLGCVAICLTEIFIVIKNDREHKIIVKKLDAIMKKMIFSGEDMK